MRVSALTFGMSRADEGNRTPNRRFTKPVLCQLSYVSKTGRNEQTRMIDGELRNVNGRERGNRRDWGEWAGMGGEWAGNGRGRPKLEAGDLN